MEPARSRASSSKAAASASASPGGTARWHRRRRAAGARVEVMIAHPAAAALEDLVGYTRGPFPRCRRCPRQTSCSATSAGSPPQAPSPARSRLIARRADLVSASSWPRPIIVTSTAGASAPAAIAPSAGADRCVPCSGVYRRRTPLATGRGIFLPWGTLRGGRTFASDALITARAASSTPPGHRRGQRWHDHGLQGRLARCSSVSTTIRSAGPKRRGVDHAQECLGAAPHPGDGPGRCRWRPRGGQARSGSCACAGSPQPEQEPARTTSSAPGSDHHDIGRGMRRDRAVSMVHGSPAGQSASDAPRLGPAC